MSFQTIFQPRYGLDQVQVLAQILPEPGDQGVSFWQDPQRLGHVRGAQRLLQAEREHEDSAYWHPRSFDSKLAPGYVLDQMSAPQDETFKISK